MLKNLNLTTPLWEYKKPFKHRALLFIVGMENVKIVGYITLPSESTETKYTETKCICDDCGFHLNDSFGDPRIEIKSFDSKISKISRKPTSVKWICEDCYFKQFHPKSYFSRCT